MLEIDQDSLICYIFLYIKNCISEKNEKQDILEELRPRENRSLQYCLLHGSRMEPINSVI